MSDLTQELLLRPRDGLFAKDGRGWYTAGAGRAYSFDWPPPSTLLGALRTAYGRTQEQGGPLRPADWQRIAAGVELGAQVAVRFTPGGAPTCSHRLWPAPADALYLADTAEQQHPKVVPLAPRERVTPTLGCDPDDPARELLWRPVLADQSKPAPAPRWWTEADFVAWLREHEVAKLESKLWPDPPTRTEVHVAIDPDKLAAAEGQLFSHDVVETTAWGRDKPAWEWALACRVGLPAAGTLAGEVLTLGGKRRLTPGEAAPAGLFHPPAELLDELVGATGFRLVVVTPAHFGAGWLPDGLTSDGAVYRGAWPDLGLPDLILRAAYVGRPRHVSGWDMARQQPKPTRRLVPPGAVYFLELPAGQTLTRDQAAALWLAALGQDCAEGYGRVVPGLWTEQGANRG